MKLRIYEDPAVQTFLCVYGEGYAERLDIVAYGASGHMLPGSPVCAPKHPASIPLLVIKALLILKSNRTMGLLCGYTFRRIETVKYPSSLLIDSFPLLRSTQVDTFRSPYPWMRFFFCCTERNRFFISYRRI